MSDAHFTAVEAYLAQLRQAALVAEAEDLATGIRHISIATGELESDDDVRRLEQLAAAAACGREGAGLARFGGGNDYVTFYIEGLDADQFVEDLALLAETLNPGWWRISRSSLPF